MLTLLLPIAGNGKRFAVAGYKTPKPFIDVKGMTMVERCVANMPKADVTWAIHLAEHSQYACSLPATIQRITIGEVTKGQACTVLLARKVIDPDSELIIADCDQWLDWSADHFLAYMRSTGADAGMTIFHGLRAHWSFVQLSPEMWVEAVIEKVPINDHAVAGVRWFRNAGHLFDALERMVSEPVVGEYYLGNVFNDLIQRGDRIKAYPVPRMYSMGTPDEFTKTLRDAPIQETR